MNKYLIFINNDDNEPQFEIVESTGPELALLNYLEEMFDLEIEEGETQGPDQFICESMMKDEYFGVALIQLGDVAFDNYYSLESLRKGINE